jgi:uncharacterized damage-inducible protein DinB
MFTKDGILALHGWTHECLDLVYTHAAALTPSQFVEEIPGFGSASVRDQLLHIIACERGWVRGLQNLPRTRWSGTDFPTAASLEEARQRVKADTIAYLERLPDEQLNRDLTERPEGWNWPLRSPAFILHHVLTHAFHHKGQVVAMFRLLGCPAPDTDLQRG